jgi:hypothetical protein
MSEWDEEQELESQAVQEAWRKGKPTRLTRSGSGTSVLSMRLPRELLKELTQAARQRDESPGQYGRELIELGLALEGSGRSWIAARVLARILEDLHHDVVIHTRPDASWEVIQPASFRGWLSSSAGTVSVPLTTRPGPYIDCLLTPTRAPKGSTGQAGINVDVESLSG